MLCGSYMLPPRDKTACQTSPCKCKICISIESDVYDKKKIQMFGVNMTLISSREVKKCIFHSCLWHSWNIHFFTSLDEIKVIFTPNIWISSIYIIRNVSKYTKYTILHFFKSSWSISTNECCQPIGGWTCSLLVTSCMRIQLSPCTSN